MNSPPPTLCTLLDILRRRAAGLPLGTPLIFETYWGGIAKSPAMMTSRQRLLVINLSEGGKMAPYGWAVGRRTARLLPR